MRAGLPNRRSIRKRGWDYTAPGWYFVTINTHGARALFGVIANGRMVLNAAGRAAEEEWFKSAAIRPGIELGEFVAMPDHVHGLVRLPDARPAGRPEGRAEGRPEGRPAGRPYRPYRPCGPPPGSLGAFVAGYKGASGKAINAIRGTPGAEVWHRNYWDVIVPDERALAAISRYIRENPQNRQVVEQAREPSLLGNNALLDGPLVAFLASRGVGALHGHVPLKKGETIISTFLSPMERAVFRAGLLHEKPMVWVKPWGLAEGTEDPTIQRALGAGRLVIASPFADAIKAPSLRRALWCNQYIVRHASRIIVGRLIPGGLLACVLCESSPDQEIVYLHPREDQGTKTPVR